MSSTYINSGFTYKTGYDNPAMRGIDDPRPWSLTQQVLDMASPKKELLDVGCGSALKLVKLAKHYAWITGLDNNPTMLEMAGKRLSEYDITNSTLVLGSATALPFKNESFDVVTSMVAPHNINEIFRVLRPGGQLIIETIAEMDKRQLKDFFVDGASLVDSLLIGGKDPSNCCTSRS